MNQAALEAMMMGAMAAQVAPPQELMPSLLSEIIEETTVRRVSGDYDLYLELEAGVVESKVSFREQVQIKWGEMREEAAFYRNMYAPVFDPPKWIPIDNGTIGASAPLAKGSYKCCVGIVDCGDCKRGGCRCVPPGL